MAIERHPILRALARARVPILVVAATYVLAVAVGILMVHGGNGFALSYRDRIVARAHASDPARLALERGEPMKTALDDFGRNLLIGAVPTSLAGLSIIGPFPIAAFRGWVGGIVSVDWAHESRLKKRREALYYLLTLALQLIPYSLTGGAGVLLGLSLFRRRPYDQRPRWIGISREAVLDVLRVYLMLTH